ncbi:MAG TPA: bis-aminopropyl spermidine synthase family protein, partial [Thermaerobacter sp.]
SKVRVPLTTGRSVVRLLQELLGGPRSYWALIRRVGDQAAQQIDALRELLAQGLVHYDGQVFTLTEAGRRRAEELGLAPVDAGCSACAGRGLVLSPAFSRVLAEFEQIARQRPEAVPEFDQGYVTTEVTVLRVALMAQRGDLAGRDLLLLGDDDLTSLAAALSGLPRRIHVLEVDERLVNFINDTARQRGWDHVRAERYDARDALPEELRGRFDVFFTDPVETVPGLLLFLSRCAEALRGPGAAGYFGLSHLESSKAKWRRIQQAILDMGFAITDGLPDFQEYHIDQVRERGYRVATEAPVPLPEPDVLFYTSTVFRLELVEGPEPLYRGAVSIGRELYFDEEAYVTLG